MSKNTSLAEALRILINSDKLLIGAAIAQADLPIPITHLYGIIAGPTAFYKWEKNGLKMEWVEGMKKAVRLSSLKEYFDTNKGEAPEGVLKRCRNRPHRKK